MKRLIPFVAALLLSLSAHAAQPAKVNNAAATAAKPGAMSPSSMMVVGECPAGYSKDPMGFSQEDQQKKGALRCVKIAAGCPAGWSGHTDTPTGKLTCTQDSLPTCPSGWHGGMVNGKLVCDSNPQPHIACPTSTPDWQWGTAYFTEGWSVLGCAPKVEPPR